MFYKQLLLALVAILSVVIFFNIELYKNWYTLRLGDFPTTIYDDMDNLDYGYRKQSRWGSTYVVGDYIKKELGADTNALLIIPPGNYVRTIEPNLLMPEPVVFYCLNGLRTTYADGKNANSAKFGLLMDKQNFKVIKISSQQDIDELKKLYAEKK